MRSINNTGPVLDAPKTRATEDRRHACLMAARPDLQALSPEDAQAYLAKLDHWYEEAAVEVFEEQRTWQACCNRGLGERLQISPLTS